MNIYPLLVLVTTLLLTGCSFITGLGTDNTPKPSPLVAYKPAFNVTTVWSTSAGDGVGKDYLKLGPAIAANKIFVADAKGRVTALVVQNGKRAWEVNLHTPITSGSSTGEGLVLVSTTNAQIIALKQTDGTIAWKTSIPNETLAAPAIDEGKVIVNTVGGKLCALSSSNGQLLWVYDHNSPLMVLRGGSVPQIAGDKVIAGFADGKLAAFDLNQGTLLWEQTIAEPQGASEVQQMIDIVANPVVAKDVVYVATYQGNIAALSLQTGNILWQKQISSYTGLVLGSQQVFVTDAQGWVWAFARQDGTVTWHQTQLQNRVLSPPARTTNALVVADGEGYVHWLSPEDGHFLARALAVKNKSIFSTPRTLGNTVYVVAKNGDVVALQ